MLLRTAFNISRGEVISLVGAGGKTSLALRLMAELEASGTPVIFTTTTKILEPIPGPGETLLLGQDEQELLQSVLEARKHHRGLIVAQARLDEKFALDASYPFPMRPYKLKGVPPEFVDLLHSALPGAVIVVEADGARGRLLKAPAPYEPVVPPSTSLFIPLAHTDAIGKPLDEEYIHRPEEVARLLDCELGTVLDEAAVAKVISHPEGGMKDCPPLARVVPVLNHREEAPPEKAYRVARLLLGCESVESVVIAHLWGDEPAQDVVRRVAGIILAAGKSERFGQPKQLLPWGDKTVLEQVVETALASPLACVVVVLGYMAGEMASLLEDKPVQVVLNEGWQEGIASSIRVGLSALEPETEAALFILADQPTVRPATIAALLRRYHETRRPIVAPVFRGRRGNPVLFDRSTFLELASLRGDIGGRALITSHPQWMETVEVDDEGVIFDIDTPQDWAAGEHITRYGRQ